MRSKPRRTSTSARPGRAPLIAILSERNLFREALFQLVKRLGRGAIVKQRTISRLLAILRRQSVPLLLVDLDHQRDDPRRIVQQAHGASPGTSVVMIGTTLQNAALADGADGWLETPEAGTNHLGRMASAAARPHRGRLRFRQSSRLAHERQVWAALTRRQRQVLELLSVGADNLKIAATLDVSERAVKVHVSALLRRFGAENRTELAVMGARAGLQVTAAGSAAREAAARRAA
jgi:DNA-binding NarL/FixJ family response regulator